MEENSLLLDRMIEQSRLKHYEIFQLLGISRSTWLIRTKNPATFTIQEVISLSKVFNDVASRNQPDITPEIVFQAIKNQIEISSIAKKMLNK